jgi:hypothetical protein
MRAYRLQFGHNSFILKNFALNLPVLDPFHVYQDH